MWLKKKDSLAPNPALTQPETDSVKFSAKCVGAQYSLTTIEMVVGFVLRAATSLRGASKCADIAFELLEGKLYEAPSHSTVQNYLLRIGLHELTRTKEKADDWILIADHAIQLGATKCLLVLGIRASQFHALNRPLQINDMVVVEMLPVDQSNGTIVCEQLEAITERIGLPKAILIDGGSDLQRGVKNLQQSHPKVILLQDIVHKLSRIIKRILEKQEQWATYRQACCSTGNRIRQSDLAHLCPPKPKPKARHMNLDPEVGWGTKTLDLLERAKSNSPVEHREQIIEKLGWLSDYADSLRRWDELLRLSKLIRDVIRREGYHLGVVKSIEAKLPVIEHRQSVEFLVEAMEFVSSMTENCGDESLPGSSEVIESLFGKGKRLQGQQSQSGFTVQLLAMAACVTKPTAEFIATALEKCRIKHVLNWKARNLDESIQSRRRRDLKPREGPA